MKIRTPYVATRLKKYLPLPLWLAVTAVLVVLLIVLAISYNSKEKGLRLQIKNLNAQIANESRSSDVTGRRLSSAQQQLQSNSSDYSSLKSAVLNDPENANVLNQIFTELKQGKLLIPPGNKCDVNNLLSPADLTITPSASQMKQAQSTGDCLKIVDDTFIGQYVDEYAAQ